MSQAKWRSVALVALGAATVLSFAPTSWGGLRAGMAVSVNPGTATFPGSASGSMGTARNSSDPVQFIGCGMWAQRSTPGISIYCSAQDAAGRYLSCYSSDPRIVTSFYAIKSDSRIRFVPRADGVCDSLSVWNVSYEPIKAP